MDVERSVSEAVKIALTAAAGALVLLWPRLSRTARRTLLGALAIVAGFNYIRWGPAFLTERIDSYDVIHYYLGAKYFDELGYFGLYPAAALVDHENGPYNPRADSYRKKVAEGYLYPVPISDAIEQGRAIRDEKFTPETWRAFERDFLYLQREKKLGAPGWQELLTDRGFNGTPPWIVVAQPIASLVPVQRIKLLCYLDLLFLAGALVLLARAYGRTTGVFVALFLLVSYSMRWPNPTWAFLRYDWIAALLAAMAMLKLSKDAAAGALTAWAAAARLFPVVWMFGPLTQGLFKLFERRVPFRQRFDRRLLALLAGFVVALGSLEIASAALLGFDARKAHVSVISEHTRPEQLSSRRVGFALAYAFDGKLSPKYLPEAEKLEIRDDGGERLIFAVPLLLALMYGLRRRSVDEAFAFGFIPFFLLATASYYYYIARALLVALHAANIEQPRHRYALAWLFGLEFLSNSLQTFWPNHRVFLIGWLSWGLLAYVAAVTYWLASDEWSARARARKREPRAFVSQRGQKKRKKR